MIDIKIDIEAQAGSHFQREFLKKAIHAYLVAVTSFYENAHKKNRIDYSVEGLEPWGNCDKCTKEHEPWKCPEVLIRLYDN